MFFYRQVKGEKGIALIMAMGALAVITTISLGFSFNMQMEYKASVNYLNGVKARFLAEAGIERALRDLKQDAKTRFTYVANNLSLVSTEWVNGTISIDIGSGRSYTAMVTDEQSKVNINTASITMLKNLLVNLGFTSAEANQKASNIITYRVPPPTGNGPFAALEELKKVASIDDAAYNIVSPYLTVNSYTDRNCDGRAPVNVNTATDYVVTAVLKGLKLGITTIEDADVTSLISNIKSARPIENWKEFEDAVDLAISDSTKRTIVKNNCNPNRNQSGLDVSTTTTEFCFFSGGYYTIKSTGRVLNSTGKEVAKNEIKAIVKIYETKEESTTTDFLGGTFLNITSDNFCPVGSSTYPNSLKIGYYDEFNSNTEWNLSGGAAISSNVLTTPNNASATLNNNPGKYVFDGTESISVTVSPRNDGQSGFLTLPHQYYYTAPPPTYVEAVITSNRLELKARRITATWDSLRTLSRIGAYTTKTYSIPTGAEKPNPTALYATVTKVIPGDNSKIELSFEGIDPNIIQVRADFTNTSPVLTDTAAILEDIYFTYLPKSKFVLWQEE